MQQALTPHLSPKLAPLPLALVVLTHVGVLAAMAVARQASEPLVPTPALMVEVIHTEPEAKPQARVQPLVKPAALPQPALAPPKTVAPRPQSAQPSPVLASASPTATEAVMVPKEPAKEFKDTRDSKPAEPAPSPAASSNQVPVSTAAAANNAASPPTTQATTAPRFDANYLSNPKPAYPPLSRKLNEQGTVKLKVLVEASGQPGKVDVAQSSGFERLDKAAVSAVSKWRFTPAKQGSVAVSAWVNVPIVFSLME
jgi:protein TonB